MWSDAALPSYVLKPRDLQIVKKFSAWHEFLSSLQSSCHFRSFCCFKNQELLLWYAVKYHFIAIIIFIESNNQFRKNEFLSSLQSSCHFRFVLLFLQSRIITLMFVLISFYSNKNDSLGLNLLFYWLSQQWWCHFLVISFGKEAWKKDKAKETFSIGVAFSVLQDTWELTHCFEFKTLSQFSSKFSRIFKDSIIWTLS